MYVECFFLMDAALVENQSKFPTTWDNKVNLESLNLFFLPIQGGFTFPETPYSKLKGQIYYKHGNRQVEESIIWASHSSLTSTTGICPVQPQATTAVIVKEGEVLSFTGGSNQTILIHIQTALEVDLNYVPLLQIAVGSRYGVFAMMQRYIHTTYKLLV